MDRLKSGVEPFVVFGIGCIADPNELALIVEQPTTTATFNWRACSFDIWSPQITVDVCDVGLYDGRICTVIAPNTLNKIVFVDLCSWAGYLRNANVLSWFYTYQTNVKEPGILCWKHMLNTCKNKLFRTGIRCTPL